MFDGFSFGPVLTFFLVLIFSVIIGIFVIAIWQKLNPPKCQKCETREREEKLKATVKHEPQHVINEEQEL